MEYKSNDVHASHQYMPKPPIWITKWGTSLIAFVFLCFAGVLIIFPYPNTVEGKMIVSSVSEDNFVGRLMISPGKLEKVNLGQNVSIHLHLYPFTTYGALSGKVSYISKQAELDGLHEIEVKIDSLITIHNRPIPSAERLEANAIIKLNGSNFFDLIFNKTKK